MKRRHVTIIRSFHVSYRRRMWPGSAEALVMLRKSQDGDTAEFTTFHVLNFSSA